MRILGIDPGMAIVGYCILDYYPENSEQQYKIVDCGSIQTSKNSPSPKRLNEIHNDLVFIVNKFKPDAGLICLPGLFPDFLEYPEYLFVCEFQNFQNIAGCFLY